MDERTCSVDGCARKFYGRGMCQLHYNRVRNTGSVEPRVFTPRVCKVEGCGGNASKPGTARGWCGPHYQRWQRYGDPLWAHQREPVVGIAPCSVEGCEGLVKARGWCSKHWERWRAYGDPRARLRGEVVEGYRICPTCQQDKAISEFTRDQSYCKTCSAARTRNYRQRNPYTPVEGTPATCDCCGQAFLANKRRWRYCSRDCFRAYKNRANWKHYAARKARMREAFVEMFDRREIFERDGWICQICSVPINRSAVFPHPASVSLDHDIPIARGGKHSRANSQTACLGCNVRKGVRMT